MVCLDYIWLHDYYMCHWNNLTGCITHSQVPLVAAGPRDHVCWCYVAFNGLRLGSSEHPTDRRASGQNWQKKHTRNHIHGPNNIQSPSTHSTTARFNVTPTAKGKTRKILDVNIEQRGPSVTYDTHLKQYWIFNSGPLLSPELCSLSCSRFRLAWSSAMKRFRAPSLFTWSDLGAVTSTRVGCHTCHIVWNFVTCSCRLLCLGWHI